MGSECLTMLSSMAAVDFERALDRHVEWGLKWLDLKDAIFGKTLIEMTVEQAERAADMIHARGLQTYCLSSNLFYADVEEGEAKFRLGLLENVQHLETLARIFRPRMARLLAARSSMRAEFDNGAAHIATNHPWLISLYREAIDILRSGEAQVTIENEVNGCILRKPDEIVEFFDLLDRKGHIAFTWDVQNMWQEGTFPSLAAYSKLRPLIGYYHLKGGQSEEGSDEFKWQSDLRDASWPVREITERVVADGVSPVICLNPSHGIRKPGYDYTDIVNRDVEFASELIEKVVLK